MSGDELMFWCWCAAWIGMATACLIVAVLA